MLTLTDDTGTTQYEYDAIGQLTGRTLPNGIQTVYVYSELGRLSELTHRSPIDEILAHFEYERDLKGQVITTTRQTGSDLETIRYNYDALGQLLRAESDDGDFEVYTYDGVGNRLTAATPAGETTYTYRLPGQLVEQTGPDSVVTHFLYDERGNLIERQSDAKTTAYAYNAANHLIAVNDGQVEVEYTYTADGLRLYKAVDGVYTTYTYTQVGLLPQVINAQSDAATYRYALGQTRLGQVDAATGETHFWLEDALSSVVAITDSEGQVIEYLDYSSYGESNSTPTFGFTGEQFDPETGLIYLRARYYAPDIGRFTAEDPLPGEPTAPLTMQPYLYVQNSPLNRVDPTGMTDDFFAWTASEKDRLEQEQIMNLEMLQTARIGMYTVVAGVRVVKLGVDIVSVVGSGGGMTVIQGFSMADDIVALRSTLAKRSQLMSGEPFDPPPGSLAQVTLEGLTGQQRYVVLEAAFKRDSLGLGEMVGEYAVDGILGAYVRFDNRHSQRYIDVLSIAVHDPEPRPRRVTQAPTQNRSTFRAACRKEGEHWVVRGRDAIPIASDSFEECIVEMAKQADEYGADLALDYDIGSPPEILSASTLNTPGRTLTEIRINDPDGDLEWVFVNHIENLRGIWIGEDSFTAIVAVSGDRATFSTECWCPAAQCNSESTLGNFNFRAQDFEDNSSATYQYFLQCFIED